MLNADTLIKRFSKALARVEATDREVLKRKYVITGTDLLIGRGTRVRQGEWKLDPQPAVMQPRFDEPVVVSNDQRVQVGDQLLTVSSAALSDEEIKDKDLMIVFRDRQSGAEEEYFIVAYEPLSYQGRAVMFTVLVRSKSRPE